MKEITTELIAIYRLFGLFERDAVCCGTVTIPQCVALQILLDEARDITGMARLMGVSNSAMTRLVDGMERRDWVKRVRATDDRRRVDVELSPQGREEGKRLRQATQNAVTRILSFIPEAKHAQVLESLQLIRTGLNRAQTNESCCGL